MSKKEITIGLVQQSNIADIEANRHKLAGNIAD
jgi:hypothetical protein